jgi:hypothetical protein
VFLAPALARILLRPAQKETEETPRCCRIGHENRHKNYEFPRDSDAEQSPPIEHFHSLSFLATKSGKWFVMALLWDDSASDRIEQICPIRLASERAREPQHGRDHRIFADDEETNIKEFVISNYLISAPFCHGQMFRDIAIQAIASTNIHRICTEFSTYLKYICHGQRVN